MKKCTKCDSEKELSNFPVNKRFSDGHNSICKLCVNIINKNYREQNKNSFSVMRKKYYQNNIDKMRADKIAYNRKNTNNKKEYDIEYRNKNKERIKKYKYDWELKHRDNPLFKIKRNLRRRIHHLLKGRKSETTFELIGCSPENFMEHIEKQFLYGMSWENYGKWHIDHIKPCFTFDLTIIEQQKICFHYSNQRPLWAKDNLSRSKNILK